MSDNAELKQIVLLMEAAARETTIVARKLAFDLEEARLLAVEDRVQISRLILLIQRLTQQSADNKAGTDRLEQTAVHVAEDLAASIVRADHAPAETPGAGADAALRSPGETAAQVASHQPTHD